jgi:hypothetical protein
VAVLIDEIASRPTANPRLRRVNKLLLSRRRVVRTLKVPWREPEHSARFGVYLFR